MAFTRTSPGFIAASPEILTVNNIVASSALTSSTSFTTLIGSTAVFNGSLAVAGTATFGSTVIFNNAVSFNGSNTFNSDINLSGFNINNAKKIDFKNDGSNTNEIRFLASNGTTVRGHLSNNYSTNFLSLRSYAPDSSEKGELVFFSSNTNSSNYASLNINDGSTSLNINSSLVSVNKQFIVTDSSINTYNGYLQIQAQGNLDPGISFHRPNVFATNIFLDTSNRLCIGGISNGGNYWPILHTGNYTSFLDSVYPRKTSANFYGLGFTTQGTNTRVLTSYDSDLNGRIYPNTINTGSGLIVSERIASGGSLGLFVMTLSAGNEFYCLIDGVSDERLKDNIQPTPITNKLEQINKIELISFNYKENGAYVPCGVSAQQLATIDEGLIIETENISLNGDGGSPVQSIEMPTKLFPDKDQLLYRLIGAVQELTNKVKELEAKLNEQT